MVCLLGDSRGPVQIRNGRAGNTTRVLQESQHIRKPGRPDRHADWTSARACWHGYGQTVGCGRSYHGCCAVELHGVGAGRDAEVLALNGHGLSNAALCRAETKNRQRTRGGRGSCDRKKISDRVVIVGRYIPAWIDDRRQSSQSVINILDRSAALRPQRRRKSEKQQEDQACQKPLPHH